MSDSLSPAAGFSTTGLSAELLLALKRANLSTPTPIQAEAIPVALSGRDLIGIAQTGTGKTLAFALPILQQLLNQEIQRSLIVVPTRELALQVEQSIRRIGNYLPRDFRSVVLIGGAPIYRQIGELRQRPAIVVATPGRLRDHLNQKTISLEQVGVVVLDEADRMLDMGFAPQIKAIFTSLPARRQTLLFSATFAPEIANLASQYLNGPARVEVATTESSPAQIKQELCYVHTDQKPDLLKQLLDEHSGTVLVFSRTKHGASKLTQKVQAMGHTAAEIHSNRSLGQRRQALEGFKRGTYRVLVATDVASRGIDVPDIALVVNYDLPDAAADYVHRIGRTGRAGRSGKAVSLATPDQQREVRAIERFLKLSLPLSEHSQTQPVYSGYSSSAPSRSKYRRPLRSSYPVNQSRFMVKRKEYAYK